MSIELILFGAIAIILFADLLLVGIKKNKTQQDVESIGEEQYKKNKLNFNYVLSRKRNILTFILLVILTKPIIHYFFTMTNQSLLTMILKSNMKLLWAHD